MGCQAHVQEMDIVRFPCYSRSMTADVHDFNQRRLAESLDLAPTWTISDRVRKIRRLQGMTQNAFAEATDIAPGTLRSWESGATEPKHSDLLIFAVRCQVQFRVPAWWTLGEAEPYDLLQHPDPRMRATARVVLEAEMREYAARDSNSEPAD